MGFRKWDNLGKETLLTSSNSSDDPFWRDLLTSCINLEGENKRMTCWIWREKKERNFDEKNEKAGILCV
jgi:hypothetical protein